MWAHSVRSNPSSLAHKFESSVRAKWAIFFAQPGEGTFISQDPATNCLPGVEVLLVDVLSELIVVNTDKRPQVRSGIA